MVRIAICTTIDDRDKEFCEKEGFKVSELLNWAISERKQQVGDELYPTIAAEKRKREAFQDLSEKLKSFIEAKGLTNEMIDALSK